MDKKKEDIDVETEQETADAPRARNRTVMLSPEMTGQLRSRMGREGIVQPAPQTSSQRTMHPLSKEATENLREAVEEAIQASKEEPPQHEPEEPKARDPRPLFQGESHHMSGHGPQRPFHDAPGGFHRHAAEQVDRHAAYERPPVAPAPTPAPVAPAVDETVREGIFWTKISPIIGFLVSYDRNENGEAYELRQGRVIVTSEKAAHGDYLVLDDETVSPMHAILRIAGTGEVQVLDQLSEHGTRIQRGGSEETIDLSGERSLVGHGDLLSFGKRTFHVCMVVRAKKD